LHEFDESQMTIRSPIFPLAKPLYGNHTTKRRAWRYGAGETATAALFLVTGAFFDFASQVLSKIGQVQAGEEDCLKGIDDPGYLSDGEIPITTKHLVEAYLRGQESPYWAAARAEWQARRERDTEKRRILDATAAELFGNDHM
jgi:hypothetical protein